MTEAMLAHFKQCGLDSTLWYMARSKGTRILKGRHLFIGRLDRAGPDRRSPRPSRPIRAT